MWSPENKNWIFHLKWHVLVHSQRYFLAVYLPEKCWIFCLKCWFVDVDDELLGNSEYCVRIMWLISFLLHYCTIMQAIWFAKFWNMTKAGGQFALASATPNSGDSSPLPPPVVYAHDISQSIGQSVNQSIRQLNRAFIQCPLKLNSRRCFLHVGTLKEPGLKMYLKLFARVRVSDTHQ